MRFLVILWAISNGHPLVAVVLVISYLCNSKSSSNDYNDPLDKTPE